jgi:histidinol-phosphatase (PHP family)
MAIKQDDSVSLVSVHGGHSGQFCNHATNSLEEIIGAYAAKGFEWVGITEHMPPVNDSFLYPEERAAGLTARAMAARFDTYMETCRRLQREFSGRLTVFVGMETEACTGALHLAQKLIERGAPDFFVGSVHHVQDIAFDTSPERYRAAMTAAGGIQALYCQYFDRQLEMIEALMPPVVGHFDLIRIFDSGYRQTIALPEVAWRIRRNLSRIRQLDLILDFNVRALAKGADEPYVCGPILGQALDMGIAVVPGDDSHGLATVGLHIAEGIRILQRQGADLRWRLPGKRHR